MIPPEQDTEVFSVPDQGSCSCQQLHPATQKQQPVSGADGSLLLPSFQAHPREILCGPPGYLCKGIRPDFVLGMCMRDEIKCVDIFNFYVNATYMMTDLNDFFFKRKKEDIFFSPFLFALWCEGGPGGPDLLFQHVQRVQVVTYLASVSLPVRSCKGFRL